MLTHAARRILIVVAACALVAAGCGDDGDGGGVPTTTETTAAASTTTATTATTSTVDAVPPLGQVAVGLEEVGTFAVPTAFRVHPDGSGWLTEKGGRVRSLATGAVALDIRPSVRDRGEMGMLGLAFDADGSHLYVSYNDDADDGASVLAEYAFSDGAADPATRRELLRVAQPYSNHNGGDVHLGPDGYLWFGLGDGGSAGDPRENGQDTGTLLGTILRIDPTAPADGRPYGIPPDNPFVDGGGRPEIWLFGVRNPWRYTFDPATGDLWVADVGQNAWEEIDLLPASGGRGRGANLGWNQLEGTHTFDGAPPEDHVLPVFEYSHEEGCSITGGPVYRGSQIPGLDGAYLFGDFCRPSVRAIRVVDGETTDATTFPVDAGTVISFGVEASGEVLVLTQEGTVWRLVPT